jgi:hypothetical protein
VLSRGALLPHEGRWNEEAGRLPWTPARAIGLIVAAGHAFFTHLTAVMPIPSAILAVLLWPLVHWA